MTATFEYVTLDDFAPQHFFFKSDLASLLSSLARRLAPPLTQSLILVYAVTLSLEL